MTEERIMKVIRTDSKYFGLEYVGELVRCRDCIHYADYRSDDGYGREWCERDMFPSRCEADGFCKWAERKEQSE